MFRYLLFLLLPIFIISCGNDGKKTDESLMTFDSDSSSIRLKYADVIFEIPSPYQTAILLKKSNIRYEESLINNDSDSKDYPGSFAKSIAIGIIGTDICYLNLYDQRDRIIRNLSHLNKLLDDIEILQSLDKTNLDKIEDNLGNNDSIIYYLSALYHNGDKYLNENDRKDIGAQIIAGGWIESMYFLTQLYQKNKNEEILNLILYQSEILDNLIKLLAPYYEKSSDFTEFIDSLINIAYEFDLIDKKESQLKIETDSIKHHTLIKNDSEFVLSGSGINNLSKLVNDIRNKFI